MIIILGYVWYIAMEMIYLLLVVMIYMGFADTLIYGTNMLNQYLSELGKDRLWIWDFNCYDPVSIIWSTADTKLSECIVCL